MFSCGRLRSTTESDLASVVICIICNRIFLGDAAFDAHECKEHELVGTTKERR
jgi:hypothetical protein